MSIAFYLNSISPHQMPLAEGVRRRMGGGDFVYIYQESPNPDRSALGWNFDDLPGWCARSGEDDVRLIGSDLVYTGVRCLSLMARRKSAGKKTFYYSERWFKPIALGLGGSSRLRIVLPGVLRMLSPSYRKMARRFVEWANSDKNAKVLAVGPWARKDFLRLGVDETKIVDWGYFVAPGRHEGSKRLIPRLRNEPLRVLWVGRVGVWWKRVEDIKKAIARVQVPVELTVLSGVPIAEIRKAMREHDLYVLASDENEGWGAALSEALEEGMSALGTFEAGASAAMLPKERLYHAGDVKGLASLIEKEYNGELPPCTIGTWTAASAAERLLAL